MREWISSFYYSTKQTKLFIFNWALYTFLIALTTVYVYARLDFVRSGPAQTEQVPQK